MATFRAQLSPHEDATLRLIAAGTIDREMLREGDIRRLTSLGLVHEVGGELVVTYLGRERCLGSTTREGTGI